MGDRGNCKIFAPNYFNPTKCQNCFKQKEHHSSQESAPTGKPSSKIGLGGKNVLPPKPLLKESVLLKATMGRDNVMPETWDRRWFALYSNGELQEYAIVDGQINKDNVTSSVMLQDFIRMLDGKVELGEKLCFGIKTLRETIYFKTTTKVDYENWWKEISTFVASPLKRTASTSVTNAKNNLVGGINRPTLCKQLSVPISTISPARSSRSSSISSLQSEPEHPAMEGLRTQISKLEDENSKLTKAEEERRKLELEVNYWKEYVTNAQLIKKSGGSTDTVTELADARRRLIQLQDELNQSQKKLKSNTGKLLMRNKEVTDCKEKLREANSIIAVYKAKIDQLTKEISSRNELIDDACVEVTDKKEEIIKGEKRRSDGECVEASRVVSPDAQHLEDKFLLLKDKLKRIERELLIKSKELEKANESRSKVAKYTRSLLQELETRLRDNQHKLGDTEEKLKNANIELSMERERRMKLEEGPRRRMSNIVSPPKPSSHVESYTNVSGSGSPGVDLTEHDVDTKYADYYRSRFKEAESSLLEKDKKLHQAEEKIKEIQNSMKHNSDTYKVINDMQIKLSDATHKLSDRQLKIHELTCEVDRLKKFEKTYGKKRQQCGTLEDIVKDLETQNSELSKNLFQVKQELEMLKIREVVLKEQLQTFADDSEESDSDDDTKLGKSVELKNKIENMIDLESRCKKYALDNDELTKKNAEYETRLRHLNMVNFKNLEANKDIVLDGSANKNEQNEKRIKELEQSLAAEEEKFCNQLSSVKEQYMNEMSTLEKKSEKDLSLAKDELAKAKSEIDNLSLQKCELEIKIQQLSSKVSTVDQGSGDQVVDLHPADENNTDTVRDEKVPLQSSEKKACEAEEYKDSEKVANKCVEDSTSVKDYNEPNIKDRDSGIVITQEIKCLIDAAKNNNIEILSCNSDPNFAIPHDSVSEIDIIEKYKLVCSKFQVKMREVTAKYLASEEKCIELAQTLEKNTSSEQTLVLEYDILLGRIDELESQIVESQELLQSKADELEKERKNVIHLVEVTSAYIKELEDSLDESKSKINELQSNKKDDGSATKSTEVPITKSDDIQDSESAENEEVVAIRQKLSAKILTLQSDISELTENHTKEIEMVKSDAQKEIDDLKKQLAEVDDRVDDQNLSLKVQSLEQALKEQNESYAAEVEMLNQHFQAELKQAFCGDNAGIDMLTRMQELEMEVDTVRKNCDNKIKELQDAHEKEKSQIKDDMATVLQASISGSFGGEYNDGYEECGSAAVEELEEKVYKLQQELVDMEQKYKDDLECEKKAHQSEMEDTIRDMMMVRNATTRYDDTDVEDSGGNASSEANSASLSKTVSVDEYENLQATHKEEIEKLQTEHDEEVQQVRSDFTLVISSLRMGNSSDAILDLHGKINTSDQETEEMKKNHEKEIAAMELKLKRVESQNFFAVRRNEEMGGKIYHMQIELEEMERKHQMEIASYQEQLGYLNGNEDDSVNHCVKENCELRDKTKSLETELEELRNEQEQKVEAIILQLQEEKRGEIEEMTDKVLKLESLIDEMKENHLKDLKALEKIDREEENEAIQIEKERIKELETMYETLKVEYEEEIEELAKEHKKEVEKLRVFYEKEMGEMKKRISNEDPSANRKASVDHNALIKQAVKEAVKEQKEIHEKEIDKMKAQFSSEKDTIEKQHQSDINDIRVQYDEKLKMGYKEGLRRQSITERKSDGTRMRQLIGEKDALQTKLLEQEIKYDTDIKAKCEKISELERLLENAKVNSNNNTNNINNTPANSVTNEDEIQKKIKENQEQIERFQRRIEYYREKSAREKTEESHRVAELQSEILELRREVEHLTNESKKKKNPENPDKEPSVKMSSRKNVEGAPLRRYTDSVTVKFGRKREMDPRKRWSNLEETSEEN